MEDSFRVRVAKAFGSLASSSSSSTTTSLSSSLWCLTDEEVERNHWKRDKDDSPPSPCSFNRPEIMNELNELENDVDNDNLDKGEDSGGKPKPDDYNDEEWDIKNSVGLDRTLDYEEEEDGYDKVAVGMENAGGRLDMSDVDDYGIDIDSCNELPNSITGVNKDPRANHIAAKIRLQEDAEAAKKMDTLRVTDKDALAVHTQAKSFEDANPKSILKRKDDQLASMPENNHLDSKPQKRVRFDPECKDGYEEQFGVEDMGTYSAEGEIVSSLPPDYPSGIPDYIRNPSKYTCYTFDSSSDFNEASNRQAYMDFLKILKRSNTAESQPGDTSVDLPKSVAFVPKRKTSDVTTTSNCTESKQNRVDTGEESIVRRGLPVRITACDSDDRETCAMEEDEPESASNGRSSSQRRGRQYRTKTKLESDDPI